MSSAAGVSVAVCIVSHDSALDLPDCLRSVAALAVETLEICVVDNASRDGSTEQVERLAAQLDVDLRLIRRPDNVGFAAGMNQAIAATSAPWVLALNPDARPAADYAERLVRRADDCAARGLRVGALTGRLVRPNGELDACGMWLRRTWRHLDRGSGEPDDGRYDTVQQVFGATGAAALYRREALCDVAVPEVAAPDPTASEGRLIFDPLFHSYREDAELCFRLHERGWSVVYEPAARCQHRRSVVPGSRRRATAGINYHSLKNRYVLRAYHETPASLWRTLPFAFVRDLAAFLYVLLSERSSLGAYRWLWRHRRAWWRRAKAIRARRTVSTRQVARWFTHAALPLPPPTLPTTRSHDESS